jgi:hypothetical protein
MNILALSCLLMLAASGPQARVHLAQGGEAVGTLKGTLVFRDPSAHAYRLIPGSAIAALDASGIRLHPGPGLRVVEIALGVAMPPTEEARLLSGLASADFKVQMDAMIDFRVKTGGAVNRSEGAVPRADLPLHGTLLDASGKPELTRTLELLTAQGPRSLPIAAIVGFTGSPARP